jgi:hypothetical protein
MSDKNQPPVKDAVPDGKASDAAPQAKPLTMGQHLFIWTMIIVVGVLFGMGSTVPFLDAPQRKVAGVSEGEVLIRQEIAQNLEAVLNPGGSRYRAQFERQGFEEYARDLRLAREAEAQGLMPQGKALDRIEEEFLKTALPGSTGRTYHHALADHEGGKRSVPRDKLRLFLSERAAVDALFARNLVAPAVPTTVAPELISYSGDTAEVVEVVLTAKHLLPAVPADDPEIPAAYDRLRGTRFTRPAAVTVTVASADLDAIAQAIAIPEADAKAWYDAHPADYAGTPDPKDPKAAVPPKPFDEVKAAIIAKLQMQRAEAEGRTRAETLNQTITDQGLDGAKDPARFVAAVQQAQLTPTTLTLEDRRGGNLDFGPLGTSPDVVKIFSKDHEPGFISNPLKTDKNRWIVLRLDDRREAGYQELHEVKAQVIAHLAGTRAWKRLLEEAAKAQAEAQSQGLSAWAGSEPAKVWGASATTKTIGLRQPFNAPPTEIDGPLADPQPVISLTMPGFPIALAHEKAEGDLPRVRLMQVAKINAAPADPARATDLADAYRRVVSQYRQEVFYRDLMAKLEAQ